MNLQNTRCLVTGGSRGIGRAICLSFAQAGADVVFVYHANRDSANQVQREIQNLGRKCKAICCDVSSMEIRSAVDEAADYLGGLDILVNAAGIFPKIPLSQIDEDTWFRVLNTDLSSVFFAIQEAVPYLEKSTRGGRIINISSQAALRGSVDGAHYCAAKSGILGLTYALAKELGGKGITVNAIVPGRIETDMLGYATQEVRSDWLKSTPLKRFGKSEDIAHAALFLASDMSSYITGAKLNISGGMLMG